MNDFEEILRLLTARFIGTVASQKSKESHRTRDDSELAAIYGVPTKVLNQAVKRNGKRFPEDFRFQLSRIEASASRSHFVTLKLGRGSNIKFLPYAFTEHGAIQAANVLNSPRAIAMGVHVVRAFV